jgi:hypothetical protein
VIDFRYHLVSIVAIFLALTVGIVMGSTVLQDPLIKSAEETTAQLRQNNEEFRQENTELRQREAGYDAFVTATGPTLLRGMLAGERVVVVEAPGAASDMRGPVTEVLTAAGATVTGWLTLTDKYLAADQAGLVDQLATTLKPAEVAFPEQAGPHDKAALVLAHALLTTEAGETGEKDAGALGVLGGFADAGLVNVDDEPETRAGAAILLAPAEAYEGRGAEERTAAVVSLATALDAAGRGAVVAGTLAATGNGGVISAIRDSGEVAGKVSTIDTLDMTAGRASLVYALREQLDGGAGQYGIGPAASSFLPTASPTPAPTAASGG